MSEPEEHRQKTVDICNAFLDLARQEVEKFEDQQVGTSLVLDAMNGALAFVAIRSFYPPMPEEEMIRLFTEFKDLTADTLFARVSKDVPMRRLSIDVKPR